jgi:hypothetical protein
MKDKTVKFTIALVIMMMVSVAKAEDHQLQFVDFNSTRDVCNINYGPTAPYPHIHQWWDLDGDNQAESVGENKIPMAYYAGDTMAVDLVVVTGGSVIDPDSDVWIEGVGPEGIHFGGDWAVIVNDEIRGYDLSASQDLEDGTVRFYNPFEIDWYIQEFPDDGPPQEPIMVGVSKNRVFATLSDPPADQGQSGDVLWETVAQVSCRAADFQTTPIGVTQAMISGNGGFGGSISRVEKDGYNFDDGGLLSYWGVAQPPFDVEGLLATGNGRCSAWASMFKACVNLQDGDGSLWGIGANNSLYGDTAMFIRYIQGTGSMKQFHPNHPYLVSEKPFTPPPQGLGGPLDPDIWPDEAAGLFGQNNTTPPRSFLNHCVFLDSNGVVYDPSYMSSAGNKVFWELQNVWGWTALYSVSGRVLKLGREDNGGVQDGTWQQL